MPWRISPILWKDRSGIKFQVFVSPGKSDADEQHLGDDEYVNVVDMGHMPTDEEVGVPAENRHWARRDRHAVETKHERDLDPKIVTKGSIRRALTRKAAVFFSSLLVLLREQRADATLQLLIFTGHTPQITLRQRAVFQPECHTARDLANGIPWTWC